MTRKSAERRRPKWLHDPEPPHLWKIGYALTACFLIAVAGLVGLWLAALGLLHAHVPHAGALSVHDAVGIAQLVFASVAGTGALVALVVAYRRQRVAETTAALDRERAIQERLHWEATADHDRIRVLNERFTAIAVQLGASQAAVRLAGVHAMAGLADDWAENRQTCVDVLCAYLRMPYEPDPGDKAPAAQRLEFRAEQQVRHTAIRVITAHLRESAATSWQGLNFDFTGVRFDGGDFGGAKFSRSEVRFGGAEFSGGMVSFGGAEFSGGIVIFRGAEFSGATVSFGGAEFSGGMVTLRGAKFSGGRVIFDGAEFSGGGHADIRFAVFDGCTVGFRGAKFSGGNVHFHDARFFSGRVVFGGAEFSGATVDFGGAVFSGATVDFSRRMSRTGAVFSGGTVDFGQGMFRTGAVFSGGTVDFGQGMFRTGAVFSGGMVIFRGAEFSGGIVDFSSAQDWSHPPQFDWEGVPPIGVKLPAAASGESQ